MSLPGPPGISDRERVTRCGWWRRQTKFAGGLVEPEARTFADALGRAVRADDCTVVDSDGRHAQLPTLKWRWRRYLVRTVAKLGRTRGLVHVNLGTRNFVAQ